MTLLREAQPKGPQIEAAQPATDQFLDDRANQLKSKYTRGLIVRAGLGIGLTAATLAGALPIAAVAAAGAIAVKEVGVGIYHRFFRNFKNETTSVSATSETVSVNGVMYTPEQAQRELQGIRVGRNISRAVGDGLAGITGVAGSQGGDAGQILGFSFGLLTGAPILAETTLSQQADTTQTAIQLHRQVEQNNILPSLEEARAIDDFLDQRKEAITHRLQELHQKMNKKDGRTWVRMAIGGAGGLFIPPAAIFAPVGAILGAAWSFAEQKAWQREYTSLVREHQAIDARRQNRIAQMNANR